MSFWDGTRWVDGVPKAAPSLPTASRFTRWAATAVMVLGLVALIIPFGATSAASHRRADPPCTITPSPVSVGEKYVVSVSGLPTGIAINLWVTDPKGNTVGSPLGSTPDGTENLNESSTSAGTWTYVFSGPTKQQNTTIYSSCSVVAN